jgi:TonB family protein
MSSTTHSSRDASTAIREHNRKWLRQAKGEYHRTLVVLLLLLALPPAAALAQVASGTAASVPLRGRIQDEAGRGLAGAHLSVVGGTTSTESDSGGSFVLPRLSPGEWLVVARRLGFAAESIPLVVSLGAGDLLVISMRRVVAPIPAIVIRGRADLIGPMAGFHARRERGHGRFFTEEQLAKGNVRRMTDLLRGVPGLRIGQRRNGDKTVRMRGSSVAPLVWLDGAPLGAGEVDLDVFDPRSFAGIEIYGGPAGVPVEFSGGMTNSTTGGAIVLWTRQGEFAESRRRRGDPTPAALLAGLIDRKEAFTASEVDTEAHPFPWDPFSPGYPDSLYRARQAGRAEVEFVVAADGVLRMDTFGVLASTHPAFSESVRRALVGRRWVPATRKGKPVPQLVQLPVEFVPDTIASARRPEN